MPKLSPINARVLIRILKRLGFEHVHQKGSHVRMRHPDGRRTTVPVHSGEKVGVGLLNKILKDINLSRQEFERIKK